MPLPSKQESRVRFPPPARLEIIVAALAVGDRRMAAKKKIHPPKKSLDRPWADLTKAERNQIYTKALYAYTSGGGGANPGSSTEFARKRAAGEAGA